MARGKLITIEGIDGAGKSTLARALTGRLADRGVAVELLREPGGVEVSERIRALLIDPALTVFPRAEALLYAAARAQLVEQLLEPLLAAGRVVVLDRFVDSSLAYQGVGRNLGIGAVGEINSFATGGLEPDLTILLDVSPQVGRARRGAKDVPPDRLEEEGDEFFGRIAGAYRGLARSLPGRIRLIDGSAPEPDVLREALGALDELLGGTLPAD